MKKTIILFFITILVLAPSFICLNAVGLDKMDAFLKGAAGRTGAGFDTADRSVESVIGSTIKIVLSFLGVVFFILVIYGGFMWMTARGNETQVEDAKKIITRATIGLLVIMVAHAITWFIISQLSETTGYGA